MANHQHLTVSLMHQLDRQVIDAFAGLGLKVVRVEEVCRAAQKVMTVLDGMSWQPLRQNLTSKEWRLLATRAMRKVRVWCKAHRVPVPKIYSLRHDMNFPLMVETNYVPEVYFPNRFRYWS